MQDLKFQSNERIYNALFWATVLCNVLSVVSLYYTNIGTGDKAYIKQLVQKLAAKQAYFTQTITYFSMP
jgi:uncharacterized membrane protein